MRERLKIISQETLLPVGLVFTLLGGAFATGYFYFEVKAHAKAIEELRAKQDATVLMATDIAVIRVKVENIEKALDKR